MTKKIIQKVCGFAVSAAMAFGSIAGPAADVWAGESAALAGAGAEENVQPEEAPVLYRITLPWTEHLIIEPEKDHIYIPDPDMRTEEEMRDTLLTYEAGEEVEIGIRAEDTWQITKMSFLDEKKEETGYDWKDQTTVQFQMPEKNLTMQAELAGMEIQQETPEGVPQGVPQEVPQDAGTSTDPLQQAQVQPVEQQGSAADPAAAPDAGPVENTVQQTVDEAGVPLEIGTIADPAQNAGNTQENVQQPGEGNVGPEAGNQTAIETEPSMTYVPEKDADGLPVQGSIEQTETLEIVLNDAGFDAKIDLRNVPYNPDQYSIEYISDDIIPDTVGTYSCIYKVTVPDSGKFFFVLRPVKVVEAQDLTAPAEQKAGEASTEPAGQETAATEAGAGQQTRDQHETQTQAAETPESTTEASTETSTETESVLMEAAAEETETESELPSDEYKVTITEGDDLGVKLDHENGTYNAGETVTFTTDAHGLTVAPTFSERR